MVLVSLDPVCYKDSHGRIWRRRLEEPQKVETEHAGRMWWKIEGPNASRNAHNGDHASGRNKDLGTGVKAIYATFWLRLLLQAAHEQFNWVRLNLTGTEGFVW